MGTSKAKEMSSNNRAQSHQSDGLPRSIKNAPIDQHYEIRRRQKNESEKRCRIRDRQQRDEMEKLYVENQKRIEVLEQSLARLSRELQ